MPVMRLISGPRLTARCMHLVRPRVCSRPRRAFDYQLTFSSLTRPRSMRICYLADGRYIHAHRWLRYFSGRGHEMSLLSFATMTQQHIEAVQRAGAKYLGELSPFYLKQFWRTAAQVSRLRRLVREEKIDVLHSHFVGVNAWYAALSRFHPTVITVMGGDILGEDWKPGPDIRERCLTPFALRSADLITCWSNKLVPVVRKYSRPNVPIEVIHGGDELERFYP